MLDPAQLKATRPKDSIWLNANAGSGKTRVLVDRVLRLLLSGARPGSILCLTYTVSGANEMRQRVQDKLGQWLSLSDEELQKEIENLGEQATPAMCQTARELFVRLAEDPQGLNINTIHGFCQSLIGRFPLEAGLSPNSQLMDDEQVITVQREIFERVMMETGTEMSQAVREAFTHFPELVRLENFLRLKEKLVEKRNGIENSGIEAFSKEIAALYGLSKNPREWSIERTRAIFGQKLCWQTVAQVAKEIVNLGSDKNSDKKFLSALNQALQRKSEQKEDAAIDRLVKAFLTDKGGMRNKPLTKQVMAVSGVAEWLEETKHSVQQYVQECTAVDSLRATRAFLTIAKEFMVEYQKYKLDNALLDYADQIHAARALIGLPGGLEWIRYKLDCTIDHIFLDEAQDNSQAQWEMMKGLHADFFDGEQDRLRTLFVVGDPKQSIYRFQGAEPEGFFRERENLDAKGAIQKQELLRSYRSAQPILDVLDATFDNYRQHMGKADPTFLEVKHESALDGVGSCVYLAPPAQKEGSAEVRQQSLVQHLARTISSWIGQRHLDALGRSVQAQDIMILFRDRLGMFVPMAHALRRLGIPVTSGEKSGLLTPLAVQDVVAVLRYLLRRNDDYQLACVLKSAFIGLSEDDLMALALPRGKMSLHRALFAKREQSAYAAAADWLESLRSQVDFLSLSGLLGMMLHRPCPCGSTGLQALKGRLGADVERQLGRVLDLAVKFEGQQATGLQGFVDVLCYRQSDNQDRVDGKGVVRVMTIHAAKGLQAPIVIMPEIMLAEKSARVPRLLECQGLPVLDVGGELVPDALLKAREARAAADRAEHWRLLYVALSRAAYELYLYTANPLPGKNARPDWYTVLHEAGTTLATERVEGGDNPELFDATQVGWRYTSEQTVSPEAQIDEPSETPEDNPDWMFSPVSVATAQASFIYAQEPDSQPAALRGTVLHAVLQRLCGRHREEFAAIIAAELPRQIMKHRLDVRTEDCQDMEQTLMRLVASMEIAGWLEKAYAEVEIGAPQDDATEVKLRRIDALCIEDECVTILDFKSDREPSHDMPKKYRLQLQQYQTLIQAIYPERRVQAGLIWLQTAQIVWLEGRPVS